MTDTERKFPLSDAELLTTNGETLHLDLLARVRPANGSVLRAMSEQRDAIVRAATAKVRAEYDGVDPLYRIECEEAWKALGTGRTSLEVGALAREIARLRAQLATARTDGAREALVDLSNNIHIWRSERERLLKYIAARYPCSAPREEAVTLSDGSVVKYVRESDTLIRLNEDSYNARANRRQWASILNRPNDTGADFDAVKALAAICAATRTPKETTR